MLEFRTISLSDRKRITKALRASDFRGCEYSFANNMAWQRLADSKIAFYKDFYNSLAKAGESGTAKNLLPKLQAGVIARIKTGSVSGVKAYAGYLDIANGDRLAFAVICNGFECTSTAVTEKLSKIIYKITNIY